MNNTTNHDVRINDIESMTEQDARQLATDTATVKEHDIYFVDFGGAFGFSCLVFKDGAHIFYANDYELHHRHREKTRDELREMYIKSLNNKLFTDDEIAAPLKTYEEYTAKGYYLHNYYGMRHPYISIFGIFNTQEQRDAFDKKTAGMIFNPVSLGYYAPEYAEFINHQKELHAALESKYNDMQNNYEYIKHAFYYEMLNVEYGINWQADFDTLSHFGNINYAGDQGDELNNYFKQLNFSDTQKRAYLDARRDALRVEY